MRNEPLQLKSFTKCLAENWQQRATRDHISTAMPTKTVAPWRIDVPARSQLMPGHRRPLSGCLRRE
jgi:hypothetical protein